MRIGIDAHSVGVRHGGNELHFEHLVTELAQLPPDGNEYFAFSWRGAAGDRWQGASVRLVPLRSRWVSWQRGVEIPLHSRRLDLDVLHVPFNFLPVFRCRKVVTIHDLAFLHVPEAYAPLERLRMTLFTRMAAQWADRVCAVSEFTKRDIMERYGVGPDRITVTPNAVDRITFRPLDAAPKAAARERLGVRFDYVLFVGTLQPRKNVLTLLDAYAHLRRSSGYDHHLVLAGRRGWHADEVFRAVRQRGLADRVHHLDAVSREELVGLYCNASALVFPSLCEGFGLPILEAMSCGCPVLSSNTTSMPEVYGDAALPFDPRNAEALATQLARALDDSVLRASLVERGFRNCDRFSWRRTAELVRGAYHAP